MLRVGCASRYAAVAIVALEIELEPQATYLKSINLF